MRFAPTDDQLDLAAALREALGGGGPSDAASLVDMGLRSLLTDGGDESLLATALTEIGYAGVPVPAIDTMAFAPALLADAGVAVTGWVVADPAGRGVIDAAGRPGHLLVGGFGGSGPVRILALDGADVTPVPSVDPRADLHRLDLAELSTRSTLATVTDPATVDLAWHRGVLGASAELVGLARRMLDLTTAYVSERRQFGVPVGSFQAVKHHLADVALAVEFAAPVVASAAAMLAVSGRAGRLPDPVRAEVSAAKVLASDAARLAARHAIQCHGAIGYTTEYDLHLFAKRAWALAASWGSADDHRQAIAAALEMLPGHP